MACREAFTWILLGVCEIKEKKEHGNERKQLLGNNEKSLGLCLVTLTSFPCRDLRTAVEYNVLETDLC